MYIMCVCLFSVLSRRVGALQIFIIIMIIIIIRCIFYISLPVTRPANDISPLPVMGESGFTETAGQLK